MSIPELKIRRFRRRYRTRFTLRFPATPSLYLDLRLTIIFLHCNLYQRI